MVSGPGRRDELVAALSAAASEPPDRYTQALAMRGLQVLAAADAEEAAAGLGAVRAGALAKLLENMWCMFTNAASQF